MRIWIFDFSNSMTWASLGIGLGVAFIVLWLSGVFSFRRRFRLGDEGDIPWQQLLSLLQPKHKQPDGALPEALEALPADQLLKKLLQQLPATRSISSMSMDEREAYVRERRSGRRPRWNPVEARLTTGIDAEPQLGLIVRQADDGLAILTDSEHALGSVLFVSATEAPKSVPAVGITVQQARRTGKLWIITCQYLQEIPWNVKVWFG